MKITLKTLSIFLFLSVLLMACKKDEVDDSPTCTDGIQNGTETGIDCGGSCSACTIAPSCIDGIQNGDETGVDCGGSCSPCSVAPTCNDGIQNGTETGVDCGGSCAACAALASVTTHNPTSVRQFTARLKGEVTSDGGDSVLSRGFAYGTSSNPSLASSDTINSGKGTGVFYANLTGLSSLTKYYARSFAINSEGIAYGSEINFTTGPEVGDLFEGGIVVHIFTSSQSGWVSGEVHGIVAPTSDQSNSSQFGGYGIPTNTLAGIGQGKSNTNKIVAELGTGSTYGAKTCDDLNYQGYTDWYMPSRDELNILYNNKNMIGGFTSGKYWSSFEENAPRAWYQDFATGSYGSSSKDINYNLRCVRNF